MHKLTAALYSDGLPELPVRTIDAIALRDPVQQREVNFRVHLPEGGGPYPVVVFSHGSMCSPASYDNMTGRGRLPGIWLFCPSILMRRSAWLRARRPTCANC